MHQWYCIIHLIILIVTWPAFTLRLVSFSSCDKGSLTMIFSHNFRWRKQHYFTCEIKCRKRSTRAEFMVIKGKGESLLGKETDTKLGALNTGVNIATISDVASWIQEQYPVLFRGVGKLNTRQIGLQIDDAVTPEAQPIRWITFCSREAVEQKIHQLLDLDIIEPIPAATPWVNPVVIVPKPEDDIRLCLYMRQANKAIIRGWYLIPRVDELLQSMHGSSVFSKLDLKWGYHQLELTPQSRGITTFAVHNGAYRYKRLMSDSECRRPASLKAEASWSRNPCLFWQEGTKQVKLIRFLGMWMDDINWYLAFIFKS